MKIFQYQQIFFPFLPIYRLIVLERKSFVLFVSDVRSSCFIKFVYKPDCMPEVIKFNSFQNGITPLVSLETEMTD